MSEPINIRDFYNHDTRITLLESSISTINDTMLRFEKRFDRIDERFDRIDEKFDKVDERFDKVDEKFDKINEKIDSKFTWLLTFIIAGFTGMLGIMAHGFHWII